MLTAKKLLLWRWRCATGVHNAAANSVSAGTVTWLAENGLAARDWLCQEEDWHSVDRYFARCPASLGLGELSSRVAMIADGGCSSDHQPVGSSLNVRVFGTTVPWEQYQTQRSKKPQQLCAHSLYASPQKLEGCPLALLVNWPCTLTSPDYELCLSGWHNTCEDDEMLRSMFHCEPAELSVDRITPLAHGVGQWGGMRHATRTAQCRCLLT